LHQGVVSLLSAAPIARLRETAPGHRTDIDGLRAIAVLLVILHHYRVPGFPGGFAGVDVFFVISGFLIAAHIDTDIRAGSFSLVAFYERRIRRILPALFAMYALVLLAGSVVLFAPDLRFLSGIGASVVPLLANIQLYRHAGLYGAEFADQVVLLHTWSLAVEEQFYLFFPLLMLAIATLGRGRYARVLWPLALLSFAACFVEVRIFPLGAFYLAPFRAWELLAGALLALGRFAPPRSAGLRSALALLGILLIAVADLFLGSDSPYPSELTLLPCVGAALILHATCDGRGVVGGVLGNVIMRRIGLWSYSLYLVHWPLLLLARYCALDPLSVGMRGGLLAATFALGALSWRYVEQPFRGPHALLNRRSLFAVAACSGIALMGITLAIYQATDPRRYDSAQRRLFPSDTAMQLNCKETLPQAAQRPACILGDPAAPVSALLWGDSHATAVVPGASAAFLRHHQAAIFAEGDGCPPLLDVYVRARAPGQSAAVRAWMDAVGIGHGESCKRRNHAVLDWSIKQHIATVILGGHWIANTEERLLSVLTDAECPDNDGSQNAQVFARGLGRLLAALQQAHVRVFLLDDAPENPLSVPYVLASARRLALHRELGITRAQYDAEQRSAIQIFTRFQQQYGLRVLKPQDLLCGSGHCAIAHDDASFYTDREHLSPAGALAIEPVFDAVFAPPALAP
jgi:peptidoglycan/LPS O-acetylase OafA/YrhL